ncbi:hypothetical protein NLI96_g4715 [Meripilus lineatus]|uniref:F-box domain-containing protein n=1 Tax=Meripilus lineatus TaxID=2056292 RepID=A0AAD5V4N2_9APHY|nr:hypothetical protein NLI96_g4715 [Physisporinus lineatus]
MTSLPIELVHIIVGIVADSDVTSDLLACSSTCRQWNAASRSLVFRHITITSESKLQPLAKLLQDSEIKSWIRHFGIDARSYRRSRQSWVLQVFDILHAYGPFPRIQKLDLLGLFETPEYGTNPDLFTTKLASLSSVTSLRILETGLPHGLLRSYISSFPHLENLTILRTKTSIFGTYTHDDNPNLALKSFTFADRYSETDVEVIPWIARSKSYETLRTISVDHGESLRHWVLVHSFSTLLGPRITHLSLRPNMINSYATSPLFELSAFSALRILTLHTYPTAETNTLLNNLPSPELLRSLRYHSGCNIGPDIWPESQDDTQVPIYRFPNLEEVLAVDDSQAVSREDTPTPPVWMAALIEMYPELGKKGMFKVVNVSKYDDPRVWEWD